MLIYKTDGLLGLIGDKERGKELRHTDRWIIPTITLVVMCSVMAAVGMLPGIPPLLDSF
ncbi:DUF3360 family protein [Oceanospirillum beijerinckii]|uniref:DUF3360 family protein n=1 Tax=Oceanospirillum beijerinckii TaxID=64976 RepID=UPI0009FDED42